MHPMLNIAVSAARAAGSVMTHAFDQLDKADIHEKGKSDYVTDVEHVVENRVIEILEKAYPDHRILSRESDSADHAYYQWIIDPINGSLNFMHGLPHFAVSIALLVDGKLDQSVIYDPIRQDLFTASKGRGAQLNNSKIRVAKLQHFSKALISTGSSFVGTKAECSALRCSGSTALDLAYVASGKLDGHFERDLNIWETAAGVLLVKEAGGLVSDFAGGEKFLENGAVVAGNPKLFKSILQSAAS